MTFLIDGKTIEVSCNGIVTQVCNFKETLLGIIDDVYKKDLLDIRSEVVQMVTQV